MIFFQYFLLSFVFKLNFKNKERVKKLAPLSVIAQPSLGKAGDGGI